MREVVVGEAGAGEEGEGEAAEGVSSGEDLEFGYSNLCS